MKTQTARRMLWLTALIGAGVIAACVLWGLSPAQVVPAERVATRPKPNTGDHEVALVNLQRISQHLKRPLQDPLYDPKPVVPVKAPPPPPPPLTFKLIGTVMAAHPTAMLQDKRGNIQIKGIGERFEGATIVAIANEQVTVEFHGERRTLNRHVDR